MMLANFQQLLAHQTSINLGTASKSRRRMCRAEDITLQEECIPWVLGAAELDQANNFALQSQPEQYTFLDSFHTSDFGTASMAQPMLLDHMFSDKFVNSETSDLMHRKQTPETLMDCGAPVCSAAVLCTVCLALTMRIIHIKCTGHHKHTTENR
jgi:hypothetical protein